MSLDASAARVLIVSSLQVYPALSGGNLRTCSLASALAARGAEVFVHSFVGRKRDYLARARSGVQRWPDGVQEHVDRAVPGFLAGYGSYGLGLPPLWLTVYLRVAGSAPRDALLPRPLRERLDWCDAVIADFPFAYPVFAARAARGKLCVLNTHNIEHRLYAPDGSWRDRLLANVVRRVELAGARRADVVVSCSAADRDFFAAHARSSEHVVVPNGIDVGRFARSSESRHHQRRKLGIADSELLVLFTASRWGPNREAFEFLRAFCGAHADELRARRIRFLVVGGVVDSPLRQPGLTATGRVDAVEPYFDAADFGINPLAAGGGTNVKMAEFIAARLPVLVTPFGARGYRIEHGRTGFVFERDALMDTLREARRRLDTERETLEGMTAAAFDENRSSISMAECVAPLWQAIAAHSAGSVEEPGRSGRDRAACA